MATAILNRLYDFTRENDADVVFVANDDRALTAMQRQTRREGSLATCRRVCVSMRRSWHAMRNKTGLSYS